MEKDGQNYLEFIPKRAQGLPWSTRGDGRVEIIMENQGFYNRLAQLVFSRPRYSRIELDDYGSFVWQQLDGHRTILDISVLMHERFAKDAEPLLPRLAVFMRMLETHGFICLAIPGQAPPRTGGQLAHGMWFERPSLQPHRWKSLCKL